MDEHTQIDRAERVARALSRLGECNVDSLALLDALATSSLKLEQDDDGSAQTAWNHAVEAMHHRQRD